MDRISDIDGFEMIDAKRPRLDPEVVIKDLDTTKVTRVDLQERFGKHGKITDISMGRGSASIRYENESSAFDAVRYEHRSLMKDSRIDVSMANKTIHPLMMQGDRDSPAMRGDRNAPTTRSDRGASMTRGDRGADRIGPMMRGDRGGDRGSPMVRGDRGGDRGSPMMRGDRGADRGSPMIRGDRSGGRGSPTRKERNFKEKSRDFHRFGRGNFPPDREVSPGKGFDNFRVMDRQNAAPHPPVQQYSDYFDSQYPFKPNDCEIVVITKQQREYAESIEVRLKNIGFRVDILFLKDEGLLINTVDDISQRGCLYAMVVSSANEAHKSVTLDILHGMPQEHRDMPLDDALKLIARNFHEYLQRQREKADLNHMCYDPNGTFSGSDPEVRVLLKMLSDGQFLTLLELERIIGSLEKQKELVVSVCSKGTKPSLESSGLQKEQMPNLQQNAFAANQMPFSPAALLGNSNESSSMHTQEESMNSSFLNFNSPSVKQALDNLIQSGPGLLKNIVNPSGETGDESQNAVLSDIDLGISPDIAQSLSGLGNFTGLGGLGHNRNMGNDQLFLGGGPIANNLFGIIPRKF